MQRNEEIVLEDIGLHVQTAGENYTCLFFRTRPLIKLGKEIISSPQELEESFSARYLEKDLQGIAQLMNFILQGSAFDFIDDIEEYQYDYQKTVEWELKNWDSMGPRLSDYGIFDVTGMHEPKCEKGYLCFYVENALNHIPYKVSIRVPINRDKVEGTYQLLPYTGMEMKN
ncbi:MAG: hypothetical protein CMO81_00395 [Waddliaceae bacterium]|nr:hypothetical protein [Waddliaceae bacterium]